MLGMHRLTTQGAEYYLSDLAQELPLPQRGGTAGGRPGWAGPPKGWDCGAPSIRGICGWSSTVAIPPLGIDCDRSEPPFSGSI